jgi:hypothetical protein
MVIMVIVDYLVIYPGTLISPLEVVANSSSFCKNLLAREDRIYFQRNPKNKSA